VAALPKTVLLSLLISLNLGWVDVAALRWVKDNIAAFGRAPSTRCMLEGADMAVCASPRITIIQLSVNRIVSGMWSDGLTLRSST
jgi:hypothetical protein